MTNLSEPHILAEMTRLRCDKKRRYRDARNGDRGAQLYLQTVDAELEMLKSMLKHLRPSDAK